jgi:hypothetical protein
MTPLSHNDDLGVVLQLEQVLGIARHVCRTTMVVDLKDIARLIHTCLPVWVRAVLDWVHREWHARSGRQVLQAQGSERYVSSHLHCIIHVIPDGPCGPQAPIGKHGVGQDIDVDLVVLQAVLLEDSTIVLGSRVPVASLCEGVP